MGAAVHRQLARAYDLGSNGILYPLDDMLANFRDEWEKAGKEKIEVSGDYATVVDYIENGEKMLREYHEKHAPFDEGRLLGVELPLWFELPGLPVKFKAIIDRLWKRDDGVIEICDYKTGKRLPLGPKDSSFYNQMGLYFLAVRATYPQFKQIEVAQYFLKHDEIISYSFSPDEIDKLAEDFKQAVLATAHAERRDDFPTREGIWCNYCEYFDLCPAKRHRRVLSGEAGGEGDEKTTMETAAELANRYIKVDREYKDLQAKRDALKEDLIQAAKDLDLDILAGDDADISVKVAREEKLMTKTDDRDGFGELSMLAREWGLEDCFVLDGRALMKDYILKKRLSPEQMEVLKPFIVERESSRIYVRKRKDDDD